MSIVISNASPLIGLCGIGSLSILEKLWGEIIIPDAVYKEVVLNAAGKPGADMIADACKRWIKVLSVNSKNEVDALQAILDEGESEVIALGQELRADLLLLDNREPRLFAGEVNLKVIGVVGIIKLAWQRALITKPIDELCKLKLNGFWIDDKIIERVKSDIENSKDLRRNKE